MKYVIYKIFDKKNPNVVYIGSTNREYYKQRLHEHRCMAKNEDCSVYSKHIVQNISEYDDLCITALEKIEGDEISAKKIEQEYIELYRNDPTMNVVNKNNAFVTPEILKQQKQEQNQRYYQRHKEEVKRKNLLRYYKRKEKYRQYEYRRLQEM